MINIIVATIIALICGELFGFPAWEVILLGFFIGFCLSRW